MACDNRLPCPCTYDCPRHGRCCACVAHHRDHEGGIPGCFFSKQGEALYDRSLQALVKDRSRRQDAPLCGQNADTDAK